MVVRGLSHGRDRDQGCHAADATLDVTGLKRRISVAAAPERGRGSGFKKSDAIKKKWSDSMKETTCARRILVLLCDAADPASDLAGLGGGRGRPQPSSGEGSSRLPDRGRRAGRVAALRIGGLVETVAEISRAVLVLHGRLRDADVYFRSARTAQAAAGDAGKAAIMIVPQFLADIDIDAYHLPPDTLRWTLEGWEGGDPAVGPTSASSFDALDAILAQAGRPEAVSRA